MNKVSKEERSRYGSEQLMLVIPAFNLHQSLKCDQIFVYDK